MNESIKIFNYSTFETILHKDLRSLEIRPNQGPGIEFLFEFESLIAWMSEHLEIYSLYVDNGSVLQMGHDDFRATFATYSREKMSKYMDRLRKVMVSLLYLPQTVIFDYGKGANFIGAELGLTSDIKVIEAGSGLQFDHLNFGLGPMATGSGLLARIVSHSKARAWLLSCDKISDDELKQSGLIHRSYEDKSSMKQDLMTKVSQQSSSARIQLKRACLETINYFIENVTEIEQKITAASLLSEDYRRTPEQFITPSKFKEIIQSRIISN